MVLMDGADVDAREKSVSGAANADRKVFGMIFEVVDGGGVLVVLLDFVLFFIVFVGLDLCLWKFFCYVSSLVCVADFGRGTTSSLMSLLIVILLLFFMMSLSRCWIVCKMVLLFLYLMNVEVFVCIFL